MMPFPSNILSSGRRKPTKKIRTIPNPDSSFQMPAEEYPHEGTWLQWPHNYGWDPDHVLRYEKSWIMMTHALHKDEKVHIIVYDEKEKDRVYQLLSSLSSKMEIEMSQIDFFCFPTDDVWVRDNGPIFVFSKTFKNHDHIDPDERRPSLYVSNWLFNAWGGKSENYYDNYIPIRVGHATQLPVIDIPMVHEGGSVEIDGRGTLMAKKSSILNCNRNPGWTQQDAETFYSHYLGVTNFIWLEGRKNSKDDITDDHIDGTARFANGDTIVTLYMEDFVDRKEYRILQNAVDAEGNPYKIVHLPCTKHKVKTVGDYGFYINFYVGNQVVLIPSFNDPNDQVAAERLRRLYPSREVVSISMTEVYKDGGMVHCVTQQQPQSRTV